LTSKNERGKRGNPDYSPISGYIPKQTAQLFRVICTALNVSQSEIIEQIVTNWVQANTEALPGLIASAAVEQASTAAVQVSTIAELVDQNYQKLLDIGSMKTDRLQALRGGTPPNAADLTKLAQNLEIPEELVIELRDKSFPKQKKEQANNGTT